MNLSQFNLNLIMIGMCLFCCHFSYRLIHSDFFWLPRLNLFNNCGCYWIILKIFFNTLCWNEIKNRLWKEIPIEDSKLARHSSVKSSGSNVPWKLFGCRFESPDNSHLWIQPAPFDACFHDWLPELALKCFLPRRLISHSLEFNRGTNFNLCTRTNAKGAIFF